MVIKKLMSLFMLFLALFHFYACTKAIATDPTINNMTQLDISYLDINNNPSATRTDKIAIKVANEPNFIMVSEKTGDKEYTAYLTDNISGIVISMLYTNNKEFPDKISVFKDGEVAIGYTTPHRTATEDFDIVWHMDTETQVFKNIPLKNNIYAYNNFTNLDSKSNYQAKTTFISVRIWGAISEYTKTMPAPVSRSWKSFIRWFTAIVFAIAVVVLAVMSVVVPALLPIATNIATAFVVPPITALLITEAVDKEKETTAASPIKQKILKISNVFEPSTILTNESLISLNYNITPALNTNNTTEIEYEVMEDNINGAHIKVEIEAGPPNNYALINSFFEFYFNASSTNTLINSSNELTTSGTFGKAKIKLKVKKINNIAAGTNPIYISFITSDEGVIINGVVAKEFKIQIK